MTLSAALVMAFAILQPPVANLATNDPVFQTSPCKPGYIWDDKKQKCVRKGLDY